MIFKREFYQSNEQVPQWVRSIGHVMGGLMLTDVSGERFCEHGWKVVAQWEEFDPVMKPAYVKMSFWMQVRCHFTLAFGKKI